jgi:hypothetical protein
MGGGGEVMGYALSTCAVRVDDEGRTVLLGDADSARPPELVKRGRPTRIRCGSGGRCA